MQISAVVSPANTTFPKLIWSVDNQDVLDIIVEDVETAHAVKLVARENVTAQNVTVTAKVETNPEVTATYTVNIAELILGDANDNLSVNVADVITISNEILAQTADGVSGNDTFCFINADVDKSKEIDVIDQSATINIALGLEPFPTALSSKAKSPISDNLFMKTAGGNIIVSLENASAYTIMQADVIIPEGVDVLAIEAGGQAQNHQIVSSINEGVLRVIVYSLNNDSYAASTEPLFTVKTSVENIGNVQITNIIAGDIYVGRHELTPMSLNGGEGTTAVDYISDENITVCGFLNEIAVINAQGRDVAIYAIDGKLVKAFVAENNNVVVPVATGVYAVVCGGKSFKVAVK